MLNGKSWSRRGLLRNVSTGDRFVEVGLANKVNLAISSSWRHAKLRLNEKGGNNWICRHENFILYVDESQRVSSTQKCELMHCSLSKDCNETTYTGAEELMEQTLWVGSVMQKQVIGSVRSIILFRNCIWLCKISTMTIFNAQKVIIYLTQSSTWSGKVLSVWCIGPKNF